MQLNFHDQLSAEILGFPPSRMQTLVQAAAMRVADAGSQSHLQLHREVARLGVRYWQSGMTGQRAAGLISEYQQAILLELCRLRAAGYQSNPTGAA